MTSELLLDFSLTKQAPLIWLTRIQAVFLVILSFTMFSGQWLLCLAQLVLIIACEQKAESFLVSQSGSRWRIYEDGRVESNILEGDGLVSNFINFPFGIRVLDMMFESDRKKLLLTKWGMGERMWRETCAAFQIIKPGT